MNKPTTVICLSARVNETQRKTTRARAIRRHVRRTRVRQRPAQPRPGQDSHRVAPPLAIAAAPLTRPPEPPLSPSEPPSRRVPLGAVASATAEAAPLPPPSCPRPPKPPPTPRHRSRHLCCPPQRPPPPKSLLMGGERRARRSKRRRTTVRGAFAASTPGAWLAARRPEKYTCGAGMGAGTQSAAPRRSWDRPHCVHQPRACSREAREARIGAKKHARALLPCCSQLWTPATRRGPKIASRALAQNNTKERGPAGSTSRWRPRRRRTHECSISARPQSSLRPMGGASWGGGRPFRGRKRRSAHGRINAASTSCHGRWRGRQGRKGEVNCEHQEGREFTANGRKKRKMSQDFLSSGMARAHGYESIFAPHAVRGRPRVFEPLQANSPFLDVLACTQTVRKMFKSWGDGAAAPSSGDIGAAAAVVIAGRKSLLTQREKGADKHFFGGGACGSPLRFDTETWESVSIWVASARVGDGGSRACHRGTMSHAKALQRR